MKYVRGGGRRMQVGKGEVKELKKKNWEGDRQERKKEEDREEGEGRKSGGSFTLSLLDCAPPFSGLQLCISRTMTPKSLSPAWSTGQSCIYNCLAQDTSWTPPTANLSSSPAANPISPKAIGSGLQLLSHLPPLVQVVTTSYSFFLSCSSSPSVALAPITSLRITAGASCLGSLPPGCGPSIQ